MMETYRKEDIRRGDIYYADLRPVVGSEQGGIRPVVILQNNVGNRHSPTVIAAAITSRKGKHKLPTHCLLYTSYSCRNMAAGISRGCRNASPAIFLPGIGRAGMGWEAYIAEYP